MTDKTTEQESKWLPNPTGKGGFKDHPELINPGGLGSHLDSCSVVLSLM